MDLTALGFNDLFVEEVIYVLRPFPRVTTSLRNAAIQAVAERHSVYVGRDEVPTRRADRKRIARSPLMGPPNTPNPNNYVRRLAARMGMADMLPDTYAVLQQMSLNSPMPLVDTACAALVVTDQTLDLPLLAFCLGMSEKSVTRIVAKAVRMPYADVAQILRPVHIPRRHTRKTKPNVQPTEFVALAPRAGRA